MSRLILCSRLQVEAEGLPHPPFGGPIGDMIYERVSAEAWSQWLEMQKKIINEFRLDMSNKGNRDMLEDQMLVYLGLKEGDGTQILDLENVPY